MKPQPGLLVAQRYELVRRIGRGGMGSVWLAKHTELRIDCALKFIEGRHADEPALRARFSREARAAAQLKTPHVVQILDSGEFEGTPYMAMELLQGEDLGARLRRVSRLSPAECLEIVGQIARALTRAHAAGIVHRDLKPDNVFLTWDDDRLLVKILDFGVAKEANALATEGTESGALLGTPAYMSPEQAHGSKQVDWRSDLWSLGVIAYVALVGQKPFQGSGIGELIMSIINEPLPVPSQVAPDVPPGFDAFWLKAAARDPAQRFQSARELVEALSMALGVSLGGLAAGSGSRPLSEPALTPFAPPTASTPAAEVEPAATPQLTTGGLGAVSSASASSLRARRGRGPLIAAAVVLVVGLVAAGGFLAGRIGPAAKGEASATSAANAASGSSAPSGEAPHPPAVAPAPSPSPSQAAASAEVATPGPTGAATILVRPRAAPLPGNAAPAPTAPGGGRKKADMGF